METHTIQISHKPGQVFASEAWKDVSILVPTEEVDELLVKLWQSCVEVIELLQKTVRDHEDVRPGVEGVEFCGVLQMSYL